jgi:DNA polymerase (family 10)
VPGTERFRLLAYVKQESMVRVDKRPDETVLTWPHLLRAEFLMALLISVLLVVASVFIQAPLEEMANAAKERGWSYIGISDHSESAFYAGGLKRDKLERQHEEIDRLNAAMSGFRILKGIEADILADGRLDYDAETLDRFDYVIGSIHSRFSMDGDAMTKRVLAAMDDPHLTILAHPTGRLLLSREPYAINVEAVLEKAADVGVAVELNADPHRLDLDWRYCRQAKELGVTIEIGPDAHSTAGLDNVHFGIGMARKAWLEAGEILNTGSAEDVLAFARGRRR